MLPGAGQGPAAPVKKHEADLRLCLMLGERKTVLRREENHENSSSAFLSLWCPLMKEGWLSTKTQDSGTLTQLKMSSATDTDALTYAA